MKALQLIQLLDLAPVTQLDLVSADPPVLRIEGVNFAHATEVRVNQVAYASGFSVLSDTLLEFPLPETLWAVPVTSVEVLVDTFSGSDQTRVEFLAGKRTVSGLPKLVQRYLKLLLTTPGSDAFHPSDGGGLQRLLGATFDANDPGPFTGQLLTAIRRTTEKMVSSQAAQKLSPDEKLRGTTVLDLRFDRQSLAFLVQLGFESMAGTRSIANLGLSE